MACTGSRAAPRLTAEAPRPPPFCGFLFFFSPPAIACRYSRPCPPGFRSALGYLPRPRMRRGRRGDGRVGSLLHPHVSVLEERGGDGFRHLQHVAPIPPVRPADHVIFLVCLARAVTNKTEVTPGGHADGHVCAREGLQQGEGRLVWVDVHGAFEDGCEEWGWRESERQQDNGEVISS